MSGRDLNAMWCRLEIEHMIERINELPEHTETGERGAIRRMLYCQLDLMNRVVLLERFRAFAFFAFFTSLLSVLVVALR